MLSIFDCLKVYTIKNGGSVVMYIPVFCKVVQQQN